MGSVREIAEGAGVSITTVSRVLNNDPAVHPKTRDLVLAVANRSGYVPTIGRRTTTNIGFAYTQEITLAHPFDGAVLDGVFRGIDECRYDIILLNIQRDKKRDETCTQFFMRKGIRGVILRTTESTRGVCREIADEGFPHIVISERFDAKNVNCIDCNSLPETERAVEYLIALGHRRIAFTMHNIPDRDHLDRLKGYRQALDKHKIPYREEFVFRHPVTLAGGATVMKMAMSMSVAERPTALFFADPMLGIGAVKKAHELGVKIPEEMSFVGFDDTNTRHSVYPTLTAVCQDAGLLGLEAARWLTRHVSKSAEGSFRKTVPAFFEVNQSTGAPPHAQEGSTPPGTSLRPKARRNDRLRKESDGRLDEGKLGLRGDS